MKHSVSDGLCKLTVISCPLYFSFYLIWFEFFFGEKRGFSQVLKIRMVIVWDKTGQDLIFRLKYHTHRCFQVVNHSFIRSQNEFSVKSKYTRFSSTKFGINLKYLFFLGILNIEFRFGLVTIVIEISLKTKRLARSSCGRIFSPEFIKLSMISQFQ